MPSSTSTPQPRAESSVCSTAQPAASDIATLRAAINADCDGFNADELAVVAAITSRLALGRERYGALDLKRERDWQQEAAEEAADLVIYRAAAGLVKR